MISRLYLIAATAFVLVALSAAHKAEAADPAPVAGDSTITRNGFGDHVAAQAPHPAFYDAPARADAAIAMDDAATALQDISPAAGNPSAPDQATGKTTAEEKELSEKFQTPVTRSTIDRSGSEGSVIHDRVGDGPVGIFFEQNKNERLQDSDDTVGINVKILEFK